MNRPRRIRYILSPRTRAIRRKPNPIRDLRYFHHLAEIRRKTQLIENTYSRAIDDLHTRCDLRRDKAAADRVRALLNKQSEDVIGLVLGIAGIRRKGTILETWREINRDRSPRPVSKTHITELIEALRKKGVLTGQNEKRIHLAFEDFKAAA